MDLFVLRVHAELHQWLNVFPAVERADVTERSLYDLQATSVTLPE
jgi:hypothetical protein